MPEVKEQKQATTRDFLSVIFRRKWVIIGLFVITTVTVIAMNLGSKIYYESEARILINRGQGRSVLGSPFGLLPWEEELSSEIELVKSLPVAQRAQQILEDSLAAGALDREITLNQWAIDAGVVGESNVLAVSYQDEDPANCVPAASAVAEAYIAYHTESLIAPRLEEFFEEETNSIKQRLSDFEEARKRLLVDQGAVDVSREKQELLRLLSEAESDLSELSATIAEQEATLSILRSIPGAEAAGTADLGAFASPGNESLIAELRRLIAMKRADLSTLRSRYTEEHPEVVALSVEIQNTEELLSQEIAAKVAVDEAKLKVLRSKEKAITTNIESLRDHLHQLPELEAQLTLIEGTMTALRANYSALLERWQQVKINMATASPRFVVSLLSPAGRPVARNTRDYVRIALAPVFSIVIGLGLAFFLDSIDHSFKTITEVEEYAKLPVLGSIVEIKKE
jgi:uncharacterized protein involved in exopolysaccharide biosynthesis